MDPIDRRLMLGAAGLAGMAALTKLASPVRAGPLDPPAGPIVPTGRTLDELYSRIARTDAGVAEPRIPVESLPPSKTGLYLISEPGSYRLTGNINGVVGKNAIEITSGGVSLDLGAFVVTGTESDTSAITVLAGVKGVNIDGGVLRAWNRSIAAVAAESVLIRRTIVLDGGYLSQPNRFAVEPGSYGVVSQCKLHTLLWSGIWPGRSTIVEECSVTTGSNGAIVTSEEDVVVRRCHVRGFNGAGIYLFQSGTVEDCRIDYSQSGVVLEQRARALRNICTYNGTGVAVQFGECIVDSNIVEHNTVGILVGQGSNLVIRNVAKNNTSAQYTVNPASAYGPIVNVAGVGDITSVPNANHPWANFVY